MFIGFKLSKNTIMTILISPSEKSLIFVLRAIKNQNICKSWQIYK